ncbi:hypothetical protein [Marinobacter phage PS6]|nr:hypothetical protein [Marinobacter phage PS6]
MKDWSASPVQNKVQKCSTCSYIQWFTPMGTTAGFLFNYVIDFK